MSGNMSKPAELKSSESQITTNSETESNDTDFKVIYLDGSTTPVIKRPHGKITRTLFGSKLDPIPSERPAFGEKRWKNPFNVLTWGWVFPLLRTGFNRILEPNDVPLIPESQQNQRRMADYRRKLQDYKYTPERSPKEYAEFWAMLYALRWDFALSMSMVIFFIAGELGMSLMSRTLIELVADIYDGRTRSHGHATAFAIGSFVIQVSFQFFFVWNQYQTRVLAEIGRTLLISAVYDKITKLSPSGRQLYPASKITSLITTDTNRFFMALRWTPLVLIFLPAFGGMLAILVHFLGVSALVGCGLVLLGIIVNVSVSRIITKLRLKSLPYADKRIATIRETVENMRIIKFYGWESSFVKLVSNARSKEISYLKALSLIEGLVDACLTSIPQFGGILSFAVRIITGHGLSPEVAFPALTLFQLFVPLSMMFSSGVTTHADAWASVKRLNDFFISPEEPNYVVNDGVGLGAVHIRGGYFKWETDLPVPASKSGWRRKLKLYKRQADTEENMLNTSAPGGIVIKPNSSARDEYEDYKEKNNADLDAGKTSFDNIARAGAQKFPGLQNINLDIKPNELIMVTGAIGSGKTTLLNVITGSIAKTEGSVFAGGKISAVLSTWSQNATIRHNILFGNEYDEKKYSQTVAACSLEDDFANFSGRDFSEVGERGITLSGGQKARLALARCVYAGGDIILLDDVLSAVDGKVANHIFYKCIKGVLKNTTRIMVTHNANLLEQADRVIYMNGKGDAKLDTLKNLLACEPQFAKSYADSTTSNNKSKFSEFDSSSVKEALYEEDMIEKRDKIENFEEDHILETSRGVQKEEENNSSDSLSLKRQLSRPDDTKHQASKLMTDENRQIGTIKGDILYSFLKSGARIGLWFVAFIVLVQFGVAAAQVMQTVFLRFWTSDRYHKPNGYYIGFYCLIITSRAFCYVWMAISIATFCFNSSSKLHNKAVETVYKAPMSYFDSTPLGRVINRFTDDIANLDTMLYMQLRMTLFMFTTMIASIVVIFESVPWATLVLIPIIGVAFGMLSFYRASARELKRINSLFRSSMFTLVTETISGISVILSYGRKQSFGEDLNRRIDNMNISFQVNLASQCWLSLRVALTSTLITLIVTLMCVYQVFSLDASTVGMLMSLLPSVVLTVAMLLPMVAELENQLNSVERLHELGYSLPQEAPSQIPDTSLPESWPSRGEITFDQISMRYRPELPLVLDNVSLHVHGGEKIGICGRTGAGKSTFLSALFRITELSTGRIIIDGVDIAEIGLRDLRTKLAIIPQEPVLFQGTIRSNLDPFGEHSDAELWDALRRSGVIRLNEINRDGTANKSHKFHLDVKTGSDGGNFSLGERQLLTLARALVRNARIIVLDEATATVDFETDSMIQDTIQKEFIDCTILCIAHRLQTIVKYDKVLVMDSGKIIEAGNPKLLFGQQQSVFSKMCTSSGVTEKDF